MVPSLKGRMSQFRQQEMMMREENSWQKRWHEQKHRGVSARGWEKYRRYCPNPRRIKTFRCLSLGKIMVPTPQVWGGCIEPRV